MGEAVDFDLHGVVGVRLLDPTGADVAKVERQLGPLRTAPAREPDVTVRFVDELPTARPLTFAGLGDAGFDGEHFYLLRGRGNVAAKARVPLEAVGGRCDIVCERAMPQVPLLLAIVNMTALAKGLLPLHASAFVHRGVGVLATGWAKGGKTECLLAAAVEGARYVGDEWVYLGADGAMFGVPEPIRLWRWQLQQLPALRGRVARPARIRMTAMHAVATVLERAAAARQLGRAASVLRRAAPVARRQVFVQVPPARLFGRRDGPAAGARMDEVFLVASHEAAAIETEPVSGDEVGRRMLASLEDERRPLMDYYRQFRFCFPDRSSSVVESAATIERTLLEAVLSGRSCTWLRHPYPVDIRALVPPIEDAVRRALDREVHGLAPAPVPTVDDPARRP